MIPSKISASYMYGTWIYIKLWRPLLNHEEPMSKSFACLDSDCSHHKSRDFILSLTNLYMVGVRWIINQVDGLECGNDLNFLQTPTWVATLVISLSGLSWGFVEISSFFCMYVLNCCFHMNEIISVCKLYWHDPLFGFDDVLKCVSTNIGPVIYVNAWYQ